MTRGFPYSDCLRCQSQTRTRGRTQPPRYAPAPVYGEPVYRAAPRCYMTRGEPVWDEYRGVWVRPRVRVCD